MSRVQFLDRGLPNPSYTQNRFVSTSTSGSDNLRPKAADGSAQEQKVFTQLQNEDNNLFSTFYTLYRSSEGIEHTPEAALKEGLGMVKTIKECLKKLELGSKLRREVWDREIIK